MSSFEWILLGLLLFEFLLRCALEIHDARAFQRKPDSFALARILPIVNDIFPPESNFSKWNENDGAFVKAHEKAHAELHHEMVRKFFWASSLVCIALLLGAIGIPFHLNLLGLLFLFHLIFTAFLIFAFAFICVPSTKTASGERHPALLISSSIQKNIFSIVSPVNLCLKL